MKLLLLQILPVAVSITINPVPIIAALIMPATRRPVANGLAYVGTLIVVMALYGGVVLGLLQGRLIATGSGGVGLLVELLWLGVGVGFLIAFVVLWTRRPAAAESLAEPRWMRLIERLGPLGAAGVGVLLVNYETETPVLADILGARVSGAAAFVALAAFVAVACAVPVLIVVASIVARRRVDPWLSRGKAWFARHNRIILLVLFAAIGAVYTAKGLWALAG